MLLRQTPALGNHWGETGLANAGVSLSNMDAPKVGHPIWSVSSILWYAVNKLVYMTVYVLEIEIVLSFSVP